MGEPPSVTQLLRDASQGHREALDRLVPLVYEELRRMAESHLRREQAGHTLSTTALVHEAYLKLIDVSQLQWQDRAHFFAMAARQMRRILIDHARTRRRAKRGGGVVNAPLDEAMHLSGGDPEGLLMLEAALVKLEELNERQCRVVECRCFVGLSVEETAEALGTSPTTVKRDWTLARAWLNRELSAEGEGPDEGAGPQREIE